MDRVIVTAGGKSWPACGTTGDAYDWLQRLGHTMVEPRPALVPLTGGDPWMQALSGVTLEDCVATVVSAKGGNRKPLARRRSSWLFTHFGFSGPAAMDISGVLTAAASISEVQVLLDLVPDLDESSAPRHSSPIVIVMAADSAWLPSWRSGCPIALPLLSPSKRGPIAPSRSYRDGFVIR